MLSIQIDTYTTFNERFSYLSDPSFTAATQEYQEQDPKLVRCVVESLSFSLPVGAYRVVTQKEPFKCDFSRSIHQKPKKPQRDTNLSRGNGRIRTQ